MPKRAPREISRLDVEKHSIVRELLVDTADDNYITARWCYSEGLYIDFYWQAVHALEKYFKAILLLNGLSTKKFSHDITELLPEVRKVAGSLMPKRLVAPALLKHMHWHGETVETFLKRLYKNGNADNRYMIFGYSHLPEDIYKLDMVVFATRRLCDDLDHYFMPPHARNFFAGKRDIKVNETTRAYLRRDRRYWTSVAGGKLSDTVNGSRGKPLQHTLLNHNPSFAPRGYAHTAFRVTSASHVPVIYRHILDVLERDFSPESKSLARETRDWLIANVRLPKDVANQLKLAK